MPKRVWITSSQLRQGIGGLVTLLMEGHEVVLTNHGAPVGIIRPWTKEDAEQDRPPPGGGTEGERPWRAGNVYPTSHLKPTFSAPPQ